MGCARSPLMLINLMFVAATTVAAAKFPRPLVRPASGIGPSTTVEPYIVPVAEGMSVTSILTVGDSVPLTLDPSKQYRLVGIPDGMGAYLTPDTPDLEYTKSCMPKRGGKSQRSSPRGASPEPQTFTLLINHELRKDRGVARRHGAKGAFVSEFIIDRSTLRVVSGQDLIDQVVLWNNVTSAYGAPSKGVALDRLCSADLPAISALYDARSGTGTKERIFLNGEETTPGRAFAHMASGPEKGISYELPRLGKAQFENVVACPHSGRKTVVIALDDITDGQMYVYIGEKQSSGSAIEKAGLTDGKLYGIRVPDFPVTATDGVSREPNGPLPMTATVGGYGPFRFELRILNGDGDVRNLPEIEAVSDAAGVTRWLRPEDGSWLPVASDDGTATFYFTTTASFDGRSRLWKIVFDNILNPESGGTITAVVEGSELPVAGTPKMMDNMVATCDGAVYLQEDPGRQDYLARIWRYHPKDGLILLAQHNSKFFTTNATNFLTIDEESSGIIPADGLIPQRGGERCFIVNTEAHYAIPGELVEGGQLMLMCMKNSVTKTAPRQPPIAP